MVWIKSSVSYIFTHSGCKVVLIILLTASILSNSGLFRYHSFILIQQIKYLQNA